MVHNDGTQNRRERTRKLTEYIIRMEELKIPERRLIATFCYDNGITRRTGQDMLEELLDTGIIVREGVFVVKGAL